MSDYRGAYDDPRTRALATSELRQAGDALLDAERVAARSRKPGEIEYQADLVKQRVAIALETASGRRAELRLAR